MRFQELPSVEPHRFIASVYSSTNFLTFLLSDYRWESGEVACITGNGHVRATPGYPHTPGEFSVPEITHCIRIINGIYRSTCDKKKLGSLVGSRTSTSRTSLENGRLNLSVLLYFFFFFIPVLVAGRFRNGGRS